MTWGAQPMCERCWTQRDPEGEPVRIRDSEREQCAYCGEWTWAGIYVRARSEDVPYPRLSGD